MIDLSGGEVFDPLTLSAPPGACPFCQAGASFPEATPVRRAAPRELGPNLTLEQNYPNPCGGRTVISFFLASAADVRLSVLDLQGRPVAGVARRGLNAGPHAISLNLSGLGLAAGDYDYQVQATNRHGMQRHTKRMTLY